MEFKTLMYGGIDHPPTYQEIQNIKKKKYTERAKKAWETRRNNSLKSYHKDYDQKKKNSVRKNVVKIFREKIKGTVGTINIACLETDAWLFVNSFSKDWRFYVFEKNEEMYRRMFKKVPETVQHIYNSDIFYSLMKTDYPYNGIYLDLCCTLSKVEGGLKNIGGILNGCEVLALTFCLRGNKRSMEDYKFDIIQRVQSILPHHKVEYGEAYRDGSPMVTIVLSGGRERRYCKHRLEDGCEFCQRIIDWSVRYFREEYKKELYDQWGGAINKNAVRWFIKDEPLIKQMFADLPKNLKKEIFQKYQFSCTHMGGYAENLMTVVDYYVCILCRMH